MQYVACCMQYTARYIPSYMLSLGILLHKHVHTRILYVHNYMYVGTLLYSTLLYRVHN